MEAPDRLVGGYPVAGPRRPGIARHLDQRQPVAVRTAEAEALLRQRQAEYDAATRLNKSGYKGDIALSEAAAKLDAARAVVKRARIELDNAIVAAPLAGYGLTSNTRLKGVSVARRKRVKPAFSATSRSLASPAWAPRAKPTSWLCDAGVHTMVDAE